MARANEVTCRIYRAKKDVNSTSLGLTSSHDLCVSEKQQGYDVICVAVDSCTFEVSDGSGSVISCSSQTMRDNFTPLLNLFYNHCSPITTPYCEGDSLCKERGNSLIYYGLTISDLRLVWGLSLVQFAVS